VSELTLLLAGFGHHIAQRRDAKSELEPTMLTALILICSVAVTPDLQDCNANNAMAVARLPTEFASPVTCLIHGQAYLAETSIGRDLSNDDRVKIICERIEKVDSTIAKLPSE
jgi:hypothetical protein